MSAATVTRSIRTVDLEGPPHTGTVLERVGLPSLMPWRDSSLARRLSDLEQLPRSIRREEVRAGIRDREAELATLADQHPRPDLTALRVDDELLNGLHLIDALLCT